MNDIDVKPIEIDLNIDIDDIDLDLKIREPEERDPESIDITTECKKEIGENLQKIREYEKKFKDRMAIEGDADFYFQVVFRSAKEKKEFIQKHGIRLQCNDYIFIEDFEKFMR